MTLLLWAIGGGFGITFALFGFMWTSMQRGFDKVDARFEKSEYETKCRFDKVDERFDKVDARFSKVDDRFSKVEERMSRLEMDMIEVKTILRLKECCMIKDDRQLKKAE